MNEHGEDPNLSTDPTESGTSDSNTQDEEAWKPSPYTVVDRTLTAHAIPGMEPRRRAAIGRQAREAGLLVCESHVSSCRCLQTHSHSHVLAPPAPRSPSETPALGSAAYAYAAPAASWSR